MGTPRFTFQLPLSNGVPDQLLTFIPISTCIYTKATISNVFNITSMFGNIYYSLTAMKTFFCSFCSSSSGSSRGCGGLCLQNVNMSYTNSSDCSNNIAYDYCTKGSFCGTMIVLVHVRMVIHVHTTRIIICLLLVFL